MLLMTPSVTNQVATNDAGSDPKIIQLACQEADTRDRLLTLPNRRSITPLRIAASMLEMT